MRRYDVVSIRTGEVLAEGLTWSAALRRRKGPGSGPDCERIIVRSVVVQ